MASVPWLPPIRGAAAEPVQVEFVPTVRPERMSARRFGGMLPGRAAQAARFATGMFGFASFGDEIAPGVVSELVPPVFVPVGAMMPLTMMSYRSMAWTS